MNKVTLLVLVVFLIQFKLSGQENTAPLLLPEVINSFNSDNSLIMIGEAHDVAGTYELELAIIAHFVRKGHRTILFEGGVSEAIILNEYLETGNEELLEFTRARGEYYRKFIKGIKERNAEVRLQGVDFERSVCLEFVFNQWFAAIKQPALRELKNHLVKIKGRTSAKRVKEVLQEALPMYERSEEALRAELGQSRFALLGDILRNPVYQADFGLSSKKRDEAILENLLNLPIQTLEQSILIFGSNHFTEGKHFWKQFSAARAGAIDGILILFAYQNCTNYLRKGKYTSVKPLADFLRPSEPEEPAIDFEVVSHEEFGRLNTKGKMVIAKLINQ